MILPGLENHNNSKGFYKTTLSKEYGTVADIDGNKYRTVKIGNQEWMAENLRTSRYRDGTEIPTDLSDSEWKNTEKGAYAIYPHFGGGYTENRVYGISSETEMAEAYGKLYNWYAIEDNRELCPEGWRVPQEIDWANLIYNLTYNHGLHNNIDSNATNGIGSILKSCRQVHSPLRGHCSTRRHPRWHYHNTHYGTDRFDFAALPGGIRSHSGTFSIIGIYGFWWSASENQHNDARFYEMGYDYSTVSNSIFPKNSGLSVRCIRE